jgi:8-oxo-dGTP pyrophosphatase MutT (NUDIX family)
VKSALRQALARSLPGRDAQKDAWPEALPSHLDPPEIETFDLAAVLLAVWPDRARPDRFEIPLIRRPEEMRRHAGQISLPGGECHAVEPLEACALREAHEEIGLPPARVEVLGLLTPVPVPISRFHIQPVVGWVADVPELRLEAGEVVEVLLADPDELARTGPRGSVHRDRRGVAFDAPAYLVRDSSGADGMVWGATAIILAEFLAVWRDARAQATR